MFTGLVETTGTVLSVQPTAVATRILVDAPSLAGRWRIGDSIAVNGTCLTAIPVDAPTQFAADLAAETVERTTLAHLQPGSVLNLELPTPAGSPLGGHVVQGHVDGVGTLLSLTPLGEDEATADWRMSIDLPQELATQVVQQGSITVNGISLTVARLHAPEAEGRTRIEIAVIPHTYRVTNLHTLTPGSAVNIETDVLAKYARQANQDWATTAHHAQSEWLTGKYLLANGY